MPYDPRKELKRVQGYYNQDTMQKRFSAIISGDIGSGKTFLLSTARFPVHIDSFDPGGTKCLAPWIKKGDIVVDTRWETEDPYSPTVYAEWIKDTEVRIKTGYFDMFGTYALDLSMFSDAVMNFQQNLAGRAGEVPQHRRDYNPQKTIIVNKLKRLMSLKCDFLLLAHLRELEESTTDSKGNILKTYRYRLNITGNAVLTIPLQFDELYVLTGKGSPVKREMLIESQGKYIARSRLKSDKNLSCKVEPNIKKFLKLAGLKWENKPKLNFGKDD